ncbi:hypothetical protein HOA91_06890 [Candidatus Woesearchaeota archaeon]|jgi:hypothetical protein|nr:hypothetical protein [Candidatus Woesearchaeota archaeon]
MTETIQIIGVDKGKVIFLHGKDQRSADYHLFMLTLKQEKIKIVLGDKNFLGLSMGSGFVK